MNVGARIRSIRVENGLSQEDLAAKAGINRTYLSQLENSKSSPTLEVLERIARAMDTAAATLISDPQTAREPEPHYEAESSEMIYSGLQEFLDDERTQLLMSPSSGEIQLLKGIRFLDRFQPSKQFFIDALFDYRRNKSSDESNSE